MPADIEAIAYSLDAQGRGVPWHGLGKPAGDGMTITEALRMVPELSADVTRWELEAVHPTTGQRIRITAQQPAGARYANVRDAVLGEEGVRAAAVLGVVGPDYRIAQTRDQFAALEEIVGESGLVVETALSLRGGRTNAVLLRRPEAVELAGDAMVPYLLVANSYDGTSALTFSATAVRVVCTNTLAWALRESTQRTYTLRHSTRLSLDVDAARRALGLADSYIEGLRREAEELSRVRVTAADLDGLLAATFPIPRRGSRETMEQHERRCERFIRYRNDVRAVLQVSPTLTEHAGTAWGYLQGVAEWHDHLLLPVNRTRDNEERRARRAERRFRRIMIDSANPVTAAHEAVMALPR